VRRTRTTGVAKAAVSAPVPAYVPTPEEKESIARVRAKRARFPPAASLKVNEAEGEVPEVSPNHPHAGTAHAVLLEAIGSADFDFLEGLIRQLVNVGSRGQRIDDKELNFLLSVVKGVGPKDQLESMLAAQMAAIHIAAMTFARRLAHVENIPQQDSAQRALTSLTRTYAAQIDTLKRYRSAPHQTLTVEHVTVKDGGQAIVGNVAADPAKG
jgi:hypothetical protein